MDRNDNRLLMRGGTHAVTWSESAASLIDVLPFFPFDGMKHKSLFLFNLCSGLYPGNWAMDYRFPFGVRRRVHPFDPLRSAQS